MLEIFKYYSLIVIIMVGQSDRDVVVVDPPITVGKDPDLAEPGLSLGGDGRINLLWTIPWSFIDCEGNPIAGPRNDAPENHVSVVARTGVPMMVDTRVGYNVHCFITYDSLI